MKTLNFKTLMLTLLALAAFSLTACGGSSGSSGNNAALSSTISFSPASPAVQPNSSIVITPVGGTPPYSFSLSYPNAGYGTLAASSGVTAVFTATTVGSVQLVVTDANFLSNMVVIQISNTANSTGAITVQASAQYVAPGGTITLMASGGVGTYTYSLASGTGTFSATQSVSGTVTFYAPPTAETAIIQVKDTVGNSTQVSLLVSSTGGTTTSVVSNCAGTYKFSYTTSNTTFTGTMYLIQDSYGDIAGYLLSKGYAPISGTCSAGTINFKNEYSGSTFTGAITANSSNMNVVTSGTFTGGISQGSWTATQTD